MRCASCRTGFVYALRFGTIASNSRSSCAWTGSVWEYSRTTDEGTYSRALYNWLDLSSSSLSSDWPSSLQSLWLAIGASLASLSDSSIPLPSLLLYHRLWAYSGESALYCFSTLLLSEWLSLSRSKEVLNFKYTLKSWDYSIACTTL